MKIIVAGGTGFLGRPLVRHLADRGHEIIVLTRSSHIAPASGSVRDVAWHPTEQRISPGAAAPSDHWSRQIDGADAVINLAGAGIADQRWSAERKREIRSSRVASTRSLVTAVRAAARRPRVFIQGSAVGYYGATMADTPFDESFPPGDDFLGQTCVAWEAEAHPVSSLGCRLVILRTGIAMAPDGGALAQMKRPFQFLIGGRIGSGRQYISWVHRDDWIALVTWALDSGSAEGVYNASAPEPATNAALSTALGRALRRPSWLPVPYFALRLAVGEVADVLVTGQRVIPARATAQGFAFRYPRIDEALAQIYGARAAG